MESSSTLTTAHLETVRAFYDAAPTESNALSRGYRRMLAHYYNLLIAQDASVLEIGCGSAELLTQIKARRRVGIDVSSTQIEAARKRLPEAELHVMAGEFLDLKDERFDIIILSDTLNYAADVQLLLEKLHTVSHEGTRLIINFPSAVWHPLISLALFLKIKAPNPQNSWLASSDVKNLLGLAQWSPLFFQGRILFPVRCLGLEALANRWLAPVMSWLCLTVFCVARPLLSGQR